MMKENDVVTVVAISGEYVGKLKNIEGETISLTDPRMLITNESGMGFAAGIAVTGESDPTEVTFCNYVFVVPTNREVEKAYRQATSGIIM
jgi:hypothetical protein